MKKCCLIILIISILLLCACSWDEKNIAKKELPAEDVENTYDACPPSVMINGQIYYCFGEDVSEPEESQIIGTITGCVDISQMPVENNQSNFPACVNQPYAEVNGDILIYFNGTWSLCELPSDD